MSEDEETERAQRLFKSFNGRYARGSEIVRVGVLSKPQVVIAVGPLVGLAYRAISGTEFYHEFTTRPLLYVNADGRQAYILEGGYRFTDRGFIG